MTRAALIFLRPNIRKNKNNLFLLLSIYINLIFPFSNIYIPKYLDNSYVIIFFNFYKDK